MSADLDNFPARLKACMDAKKMNYAEVARLIDVDKGRIYHWVKGKNLPQAYYVAKLCEVLEVSADYLLLGKGEP